MPIDLKQTQLRQQRTILYSLAIGGTLSGLLIWSITPFITQNKTLRYLSLIYTALAGSLTCFSSSVLINNRRIYKALDSSEIDDYLHQLATEQFRQQGYWENRATSANVNPEMLDLQGLPENLPISGNGKNGNLHDPEMLAEVSEAINEGISDSRIIQNILGYKGRYYNEGRNLLKQIKNQMETEQNGE
ncbi:MAG: hypothetical protein J7647_22310 [Cyanobacteria bacterium SBLK]|nr:hypothetical protein [Cyanobacteria bacterium SBLK]